MKTLFTILLISLAINVSSQTKLIASCCSSKNLGKCSGDSSCRSCKNCKYCAHCNSGGTCGVCSSSSKEFYSKPKSKRKTSSTAKSYRNEELLFVKSKKLNVRSEPKSDSEIIEQLNYGDYLLFLELSGDWIKVRVSNSGKIGYVCKKFVA